jgi:hypothetical protein
MLKDRLQGEVAAPQDERSAAKKQLQSWLKEAALQKEAQMREAELLLHNRNLQYQVEQLKVPGKVFVCVFSAILFAQSYFRPYHPLKWLQRRKAKATRYRPRPRKQRIPQITWLLLLPLLLVVRLAIS